MRWVMPADIHQVAGHDEERHRQQRKRVDAADHAIDDDEMRLRAFER